MSCVTDQTVATYRIKPSFGMSGRGSLGYQIGLDYHYIKVLSLSEVMPAQE